MPTPKQTAMWAKVGVTMLADPWPERIVYRDYEGEELHGTVVEAHEHYYTIMFDGFDTTANIRADQSNVRAE